MPFEAVVEAEDVDRILEALSTAGPEMHRAMFCAVERLTQHGTRLIKLSITERLNQETGLFRESWRTTHTIDDGTTIIGQTKSSDIRARILDEGGKILPKNAKRLTVPDQRNPPPPGVFAREMPGLHLQKTKDGRAFLADEQGRARWWLRSSVTITGRHYIPPVVDELTKDAVVVLIKAVADTLQEAVDDAVGG